MCIRDRLQEEAEVGLVGADEVGRGVNDGPVERQQRLVPLPVSYTHLRAHETLLDLVCRLLL